MVKNLNGGNRSKGLARKFLYNDTPSSVRLPDNDLEVFAVLTKMYGTICDVTTSNGDSFKCHIRGKFRGRSKRNSIVQVGSILLVGFRHFEAPHFKNCDLLELYDSHDISILQNISSIDISHILSISQNPI